jgi:uncharacterized repeat protein (TIGR03803 family)
MPDSNSLVWSIRKAILCLGVFSSVMVSLAAHAQTLLYEFTGGADGAGPIGGVVQDSTGTLYGETSMGGAAGCTSKAGQPSGGCGTVYSFNTTAGLKVLASFTGANGAYGEATLTLVGTTLYGTTNNGGASDDGVVFSVQTDGTGFTLLHQFSGADGKNPTGILRQGAGGVLYGITEYGGTHNDGVLFSLKPSGTFSVLHDFAGGTKDGETPTTLLISSSGTLVGSSEQGGNQSRICDIGGCGTIFEYVPSSKIYSVAYKFVAGNGVGGFIGSIGPGPTVYGNDGAPFALSLATGLVQYAEFPGYASGGWASGPLLASKWKLDRCGGSRWVLVWGALQRYKNNKYFSGFFK